MKTLTDIQLEGLSGETLTLCFCWRLTRSDGQVFGLTSHDRPLERDGIVFTPGAVMTAEQFDQTESLSPDAASATGALASDLIRDEDLRNGLWDGCQVEVYRTDWQVPEFGLLHVWSGFLSAVTMTEDGAFQAELVSLKADLQRPIGRVLQRRCDAVLGDARCGAPVEGRTCDQRLETCRDVFANSDNYRGFPHLPGNDFILSGPAPTDNDGGKR
ncbi:MAG: DUF2163 domain-containing protein [Pseudomonadota bacterium]